MAIVIDNTKDTNNRFAENRKRFFERLRLKLRQAVRSGDGILVKDLDSGVAVSLDVLEELGDSIKEYHFAYEGAHNTNHVITGDKQLIIGDKRFFELPPAGGGSGESGEGEEGDSAYIELSKDELIDLLFKNWKLPNCVVKTLTKDHSNAPVQEGYINEGNFSSLSLMRTMEESMGRYLSMKKELEDAVNKLMISASKVAKTTPIKKWPIYRKVADLKVQLKNLPLIDDVDLKFHYRQKLPVSITKSVIVFILDSSGSMGEDERALAKYAFYLVNSFIQTEYTSTDVVFIRHTEQAEEVNANQFFKEYISGGTSFSNAYFLTKKILEDRYPINKYNRYVVQASDGDTFTLREDIAHLYTQLVPSISFFLYCNISPMSNNTRFIWAMDEEDRKRDINTMKTCFINIESPDEVYPLLDRVFGSNKHADK